MESRISRLEERVGCLETLLVQVLAQRSKPSSPGDFHSLLKSPTGPLPSIPSNAINRNLTHRESLIVPKTSPSISYSAMPFKKPLTLGDKSIQPFNPVARVMEHDELDDIFFELSSSQSRSSSELCSTSTQPSSSSSSSYSRSSSSSSSSSTSSLPVTPCSSSLQSHATTAPSKRLRLSAKLGAEERRRLLDPKTWLNDTIIDYWIEVISRKNTNPIYGFVGVFFYEKIKTLDGRIKVQSWLQHLDLKVVRLIFIPINITNFHWILAVLDLDNQSLNLFDSLHGGAPRTSSKEALLQPIADWITIQFPQFQHFSQQFLFPPQQKDAYRCGDFVLAFIEAILRRHQSGLTPAVDLDALDQAIKDDVDQKRTQIRKHARIPDAPDRSKRRRH